MCLSCSGVHRGLGVHISFIRSITMDAFKGSELARMAAGGNKPFQDFFNSHPSNKKEGRTFDASSIQERYDSEAGDEWKERLSCKVEGREFDKSNLPKRVPKKDTAASGMGAPLSGKASGPGSRSQTPLSRTRSNEPGFQRSGSPALGTNAMSQKTKNEAYFARMGAENANRRDDVPPNQGGKYGGFGSEPDHWKKDDEPGAAPALDDFQKDPVAAITKGFGWLGANVSKAGKSGYEGWLKPGMQKVSLHMSRLCPRKTVPLTFTQLAEADLASQARNTAASLGQGIQSGATAAGGALNRFVEGSDGHSSNRSVQPEKKDFWDSFGAEPKGPSADKKDFWDDFGAAPKGPSKDKQDFWDEFATAGETRSQTVGTGAAKKPSGIGTAAMKKKKEDEWGDW